MAGVWSELNRFIGQVSEELKVPRDTIYTILERFEDAGCIELKGPVSSPDDFRMVTVKINDGLKEALRQGTIDASDVLKDGGLPVTLRNLRRVNIEIGKMLRLTNNPE